MCSGRLRACKKKIVDSCKKHFLYKEQYIVFLARQERSVYLTFNCKYVARQSLKLSLGSPKVTCSYVFNPWIVFLARICTGNEAQDESTKLVDANGVILCLN